MDALSTKFVTDVFDFPALNMSAGTVGTFCGTVQVSIAKSGYTAVAAQLTQIGHSSAYIATLAFNNSTAFAVLYRASSSAITQPAGDLKVRVLYMKS